MNQRGGIAGMRMLQGGLFAAVLACATAPALWTQDAPSEAVPAPAAPTGPAVTVRGVVLNETTGQPVRRALVRVNSALGRGALTDGEGRFEIHGVTAGVQLFTVSKPGFQEQMGEDERQQSVVHSVRVAIGMPDLSLTLAPKNAIFGHVSLSTGTPALGIGVTLVRQTIEDGRAEWEQVEGHQTTPDGAFRFAGLMDGTYLLMTQAEFEGGHAVEPSCSAESPAVMPGYAIEFYSGAAEFAGAARIAVAGGQNAEANLALNQTMYHLVEVSLARAPAGGNWEFKPVVLDHGGQELEYPIHQEKDHALCVYLPDGSYTLVMRATAEQESEGRGARIATGVTSPKEMLGLLDFSVDGQAVRNLRVALGQAPSTPVHLRYQPGPPAPSKANSQEGEEDGEGDPLSISLVPANLVGQKSQQRVEGTATGESTYELEAALPGSYWLEATATRQGVCIGAATAGGQNLARTPWVEGPSGTGMPIDMVLRTDCAKLTVQVPEALTEESAGEGANLFIYAVPEFDSVEGLYQGQAQQFGERTATIEDMAPGSYRVFAFRAPRSIEFRSAAALDRLGAGQRVTLEPGASGNLVLEGISK